MTTEREHTRTRRQSLAEYPLRRKVLVSALLLILAGSVLNTLFGTRGLFGLMEAREDLATLESEIRSLEDTNRGMRQEIKALREDPMAVEKRAREVLGMSRPDETVIVLRQPE